MVFEVSLNAQALCIRMDSNEEITNKSSENVEIVVKNVVQRPRRKRFRNAHFNTNPQKESRLKASLLNDGVDAQVLIFDCGGYSMKINYSTEEEPKILPNCIMKAKSERKRLFIGNQIDDCRDCSGLYFLLPCERGYITRWDIQKPIWDYVFSKQCFPIGARPILMTQPLFNFKSIQDCVDEIFFEEYEVQAMFRMNPTDMALAKYQQDFQERSPCIIVDCGYSFTHVVPYIDGKKYWKAIKRLNIGGKLLTNYLKDIISYRQYHVMEETFVINQVKEDTCYVSECFKNDLKIANSNTRNQIVRNYVLPDFNTIRRGYIQDTNSKKSTVIETRDKKPNEDDLYQILRLNNERFTVPEILFHPSDIGMKSTGVGEAIYRSILACPLKYQQDLAQNIIIIGGSTNFPGFKQRLYNELRSMICATWHLNIYQPDSSITYSWLGGRALLEEPSFRGKFVTRAQYEEMGQSALQARFNDWSSVENDEYEEGGKEKEVEPFSYINYIKKYDIFGKNGETQKQSNHSGKNGKTTATCQNDDNHNSSNGTDDNTSVPNDVRTLRVSKNRKNGHKNPNGNSSTVK